MRNVFAWQTDGAGCYFYRIMLPLTHLPQDRFRVAWGEPGPDILDHDVVIGQRIAGDNELWERICRDPGTLAVYDIDDDLLNIDPDNVVPYGIYAPLREGTARMIAMADVVTVSTPKLADYLSQFNPDVRVLRNCVPNELPGIPRRERRGLTVGWGGSMFHAQDWGGVNEVLREVHRKFPGVSFRSVGADYMGGAVPTSVSGWTNVTSYHMELDFHIGIAPLQATPFNERKSWIKVLEYAARGIPCVAANVGQYPEWVDESGGGLIASSHDEWVEHIRALLDDDTRTRLGGNALTAARRYTIGRQVHLWAQVYDG